MALSDDMLSSSKKALPSRISSSASVMTAEPIVNPVAVITPDAFRLSTKASLNLTELVPKSTSLSVTGTISPS